MMHDPSTLAFTIPNPLTGRVVSWSKRRYYDALIEVWHIDPEADGSDDSCRWFGPSLTEAERAWLKKEGRQEWGYMFRGVPKRDEDERGELTENTRGEFWPGSMIHASALEVAYAAWSIIAWRMPDADGLARHERMLSSWRQSREMRSAIPHLLSLVGNSTDSISALVTRARAISEEGAKATEELFLCVARNRKQIQRPWYRHPRWHIRHWRVRFCPWINLYNWFTRRCHLCGTKFRWGQAPVYDSRGYSHMNCIEKTIASTGAP